MGQDIRNIKGVIFDWAGTTVDYGCMAPVLVFVEVFRKKGIDITMQEAREPMGMLKLEHIRAICAMDRVKELWKEKYNRYPTEQDVLELYGDFEQTLFSILENYAEPVPGILDVVNFLRANQVKIGSTSGYTREMMNIVAPVAASRGYAPDYIVTADEVRQGRPHPYMCYQNAIGMGVYPLWAMVKFGDTVSDIKEGLNAGMWTVGIIKGGSELGLSQQELQQLDRQQLNKRVSAVKKKFTDAGAHFVIDSMEHAIDVLLVIDDLLAQGLKPDI